MIHYPQLGVAVRFALCAILPLIFVACGNSESGNERRTDGTFRIVATTSMIEDAVHEIVGDRAQVSALMGPGVDPHLYKATQGDLAQITGADIVFYNGLHLEGKMVDALEKLGRTRRVEPVAEAIDTSLLRRPPEFEGRFDPHVWFDVRLWSHVVRRIAEVVSDVDTAHAAEYAARADAYLKRLDSLDAWVRTEIATIPIERRVLITAHDAFGYFGDAYNIEVRGLQGISTVTESGVGDIAAMVDLITKRGIKAVFVETSIPRRSIDAVVGGAKQRGSNVSIGGTLFSDAMGGKETPEGTYIGMVSYNVRTIVGALR